MKRLCWVALFVSAACGGDDRTSEFIGTWMYLAGSTGTLDCADNQLDMTNTLTGTFQLAAGTSSDLVEVSDPGSACPPIRLDVSDGTASAQSGQSCTEMDSGITAMTTVNSYTVTLDSAGTKATFTGQAALTLTGAAMTTCTVMSTGSAMKVAAREGEVPTSTIGKSFLVHPLRAAK
jgi:hypothetical protein